MQLCMINMLLFSLARQTGVFYIKIDNAMKAAKMTTSGTPENARVAIDGNRPQHRRLYVTLLYFAATSKTEPAPEL